MEPPVCDPSAARHVVGRDRAAAEPATTSRRGPGRGFHGLRVIGGSKAGERGRHRLAEEERPGRAEVADDGGILTGDRLGPAFGAGRGRPVGDVDDVLDAEGHAVERPAVVAGGELAVADFRLGEGPVAVDRDPGVHGRVVAVDLREALMDQADRGDLVSTNRCGRLVQGEDRDHLVSARFFRSATHSAHRASIGLPVSMRKSATSNSRFWQRRWILSTTPGCFRFEPGRRTFAATLIAVRPALFLGEPFRQRPVGLLLGTVEQAGVVGEPLGDPAGGAAITLDGVRELVGDDADVLRMLGHPFDADVNLSPGAVGGDFHVAIVDDLDVPGGRLVRVVEPLDQLRIAMVELGRDLPDDRCELHVDVAGDRDGESDLRRRGDLHGSRQHFRRVGSVFCGSERDGEPRTRTGRRTDSGGDRKASSA